MPVLTFDVGGPDEMNVECVQGGHAAPRKVGDRGYSASGSEFSQVRDELMVVPFVSAPLPWTQIATIRGLFSLARRVNCAGDLFNRAGTIVCSGTITDDLHETGDRGTVNGTLFEVGSTLTYTPAVSTFLLTGVDSPDSGDPTVFVSTPNASYPGDASTGFACLVPAVPATCICPAFPAPPTICATSVSSSPERAWLSVPLAAGVMSGTPVIRIETDGSSATVWGHMSTKALIYQVRGGVNIAGPLQTNYVGTFGGLGPSEQYMTATSSVVWALQNNDRILIEFWSRLALNCGQSDNTDRQFIWHGAIPGPRRPAIMSVSGFIQSYP